MDKRFDHIYLCLDCQETVVIEHPDDFSYMDDCPQCGNDNMECLDIVSSIGVRVDG